MTVSSSELDILETCERNLGIASPDTLRAAIRLLEESEAGNSETGIEYAYIASELMRLVYPLAMGDKTVPEPPVGSIFPGLFKDAEAGRYSELPQQDVSFFTVLSAPVAVLFTENKTVEMQCMENIDQAVRMNRRSVLPVYLRGYINERNGSFDAALSDYSAALEMDPSCYPAETGTARIYLKTGRPESAAEIMDMLTAQYPFSIDLLITAAETRYFMKDFSGALSYSAEALRMDPNNPENLMLRARIYLEQGNLQQTRRLLDILERAGYDPPSFFLLKSELQKAGSDYLSALNTLEEAKNKYPNNRELNEAYGAVLMLAGRKDEGHEILTGNSGESGTGPEGLIALIDYAIEMEDWEAAEDYAEKLVESDDSFIAGKALWRVWYYQKDLDRAVLAAEDLYQKYPDQPDSSIIYIKTLIDMNRRLQAERILGQRLPLEKDAVKKSELYYLKSLLTDSEEERLQALRSALFENLQNIDALMGITRLYVETGDIRKAYRYIKQAAALAPDNEEILEEMKRVEGLLN